PGPRKLAAGLQAHWSRFVRGSRKSECIEEIRLDIFSPRRHGENVLSCRVFEIPGGLCALSHIPYCVQTPISVLEVGDVMLVSNACHGNQSETAPARRCRETEWAALIPV